MTKKMDKIYRLYEVEALITYEDEKGRKKRQRQKYLVEAESLAKACDAAMRVAKVDADDLPDGTCCLTKASLLRGLAGVRFLASPTYDVRWMRGTVSVLKENEKGFVRLIKRTFLFAVNDVDKSIEALDRIMNAMEDYEVVSLRQMNYAEYIPVSYA